MSDLADVLRARPWAQPLIGTVTAVSLAPDAAHTTTARVSIYGSLTTVVCTAQYVPTVGDVALVLVADRRMYAVGSLSRGSAPVIPPPPAPPSTGTLTVPATHAGTYANGSWRTDRSDVVQGTDTIGTNQGAWFYGTTLPGTLAGLTPTAIRAYAHRVLTGPPETPVPIVFYLHNIGFVPAAPPPVLATFTSAAITIDNPQWVTLPLPWAQQMAAGTASGIGIGPPDVTAQLAALASLTTDRQSGTIQVDWSR